MSWPGTIENTSDYCSHECIKYNPKFFHSLDDEVLSQTFSDANFVIEKAELFKRDNLPEHIKLDGRENVGLIARKPA